MGRKKGHKGKRTFSKSYYKQKAHISYQNQKYLDQQKLLIDPSFTPKMDTSNVYFIIFGLMILGSSYCYLASDNTRPSISLSESTRDRLKLLESNGVSIKDIECSHNYNEAALSFNEKFAHAGIYRVPSEHGMCSFYDPYIETEEYNYKLGFVSRNKIVPQDCKEYNYFANASEYFRKVILSLDQNEAYNKFVYLAKLINNNYNPFVEIEEGTTVVIKNLPNNAPGDNDYHNFLKYLYSIGESRDAEAYVQLADFIKSVYGQDINNIGQGEIRKLMYYFTNMEPDHPWANPEISLFAKKYYSVIQPKDTKEVLKSIFSSEIPSQKIVDIVYFAAKAHMQIVEAHGLEDGNGRLARFVMNYFLNKTGCSIIFNEDVIYNQSVIDSIGKDDPDPLFLYVFDKIQKLNVLSEETSFDFSSVQAEIKNCMLSGDSSNLDECIELLPNDV